MSVEKNNGEFWAGVFHDLKSPMISIHFALSMHKDRSELLEEIYRLNASNLRFIQELLDYYSFENGFYHHKIGSVCLNKILEDKLAHSKYFLREKNLSVKKKGFECEYVVNFCPIGVSRIFANLISNATKFACENSEIIIAIKNVEKGVLVSFFDHGEKIPEGMERKIFEKFETTAKNSNGLGLFICKQLTDKFGGKIWLENYKDGVRTNVLFVN